MEAKSTPLVKGIGPDDGYYCNECKHHHGFGTKISVDHVKHADFHGFPLNQLEKAARRFYKERIKIEERTERLRIDHEQKAAKYDVLKAELSDLMDEVKKTLHLRSYEVVETSFGRYNLVPASDVLGITNVKEFFLSYLTKDNLIVKAHGFEKGGYYLLRLIKHAIRGKNKWNIDAYHVCSKKELNDHLQLKYGPYHAHYPEINKIGWN